MSTAVVSNVARRWSCFVVICFAWALNSRAAEQTAAVKLEFRISAQPLDDALQEFSRQSGLQVIFLSDLTEGIPSPGVRGEHTVAEALEALLAGSGLTFRMINARTVSIRRAGGA